MSGCVCVCVQRRTSAHSCMRARRPCLFSSSFGTFRRVHSRQIHARVPLHTSTLNLTRVTHVSAPSALPPALSRAGLATLCGIYSVARSSGHIPAGMWWPIISLLGMLDDIESVICSPVWVAPNFFFFTRLPRLSGYQPPERYVYAVGFSATGRRVIVIVIVGRGMAHGTHIRCHVNYIISFRQYHTAVARLTKPELN